MPAERVRQNARYFHPPGKVCAMKSDYTRWIPMLFVVLLVAACQRAESVEASALNEASANEAAAATLFAVWNTKEYDRLDAALAPGFRRQGPDQNAESLVEMKEFMRQVHDTYPDFQIESNETVYEGDIGFRHWTVTGTYAANGKRIEISGITMHRFQDGMMTGESAYYDTATIEAQLDVEAVPHAR